MSIVILKIFEKYFHKNVDKCILLWYNNTHKREYKKGETSLDSVISSKNTKGTVNFSKTLIHSVAKLIDVSPKSFQLFLTLSAYCDDNGSIITDKKTLSHLINEEARKVDYCLRCLQEHDYIKIEPVHVDYSKDI